MMRSATHVELVGRRRAPTGCCVLGGVGEFDALNDARSALRMVLRSIISAATRGRVCSSATCHSYVSEETGRGRRRAPRRRPRNPALAEGRPFNWSSARAPRVGLRGFASMAGRWIFSWSRRGDGVTG